MSEKTITRVDRESLDRLPEGWFEINQVTYRVRSPRFRCDRLVERGLLESKVIQAEVARPCIGFQYKTIYRKLP